jgi:diaminopimelate decarboxylase
MDRRNFIKLTALGTAGAATILSSKQAAAAAKDSAAFQPGSVEGLNFVNLNGSEAVIAGYPVSWWAKNYDLPVHIHYAPAIAANTKAFRKVFEERYPKAEIRFAAKANPHPAVFKTVVDAGEGVDVASEYEAKGALKAGADPIHMDANGNAKTDDFLRLAIGKNMLIISDSPEEFQLIAQLSKEMNAKPRVMQRLSGFSLGNVTQASSFTAGSWTKFGLNIKNFNDFLPLIDKFPDLDFQGFHVHIGSPIATLEPYQIVAAKMIEYSQALAERKLQCKMLNIGGGFPVNYLDKQQWNTMLDRIREGYKAAKNGDFSKTWAWDNSAGGFQDEQTGEVDLENWTGERFYSDFPKDKMLDALLASDISVNGKSVAFVKALKDLGEPTLVIEPGRSIAEDTGVTLSRTQILKKVDGIHDLVAMDIGVVNLAESLEHTIPMNRWALATGRDRKDPSPFETFIAGHLCFTGDMPSRYKVQLPRKPERGDVLMTWDTGAYAPHFYAANTNAFPRPARLLVHADGSMEYLKTRDTLEEVYSMPI